MIIKNILVCASVILLSASCKQSNDDSEIVMYIDKSRLVNINRYLVNKDLDIMRHFVRRKSWRMSFSDNGYFYEIFNVGELPQISDNDRVTCDYTITLPDGTLCYDIKNKIFIVGGSEEISGLHHAVKFLGKGGKARFIFPAHLAYGMQGDFNTIPPRAILIYNVHITEVQH